MLNSSLTLAVAPTGKAKAAKADLGNFLRATVVNFLNLPLIGNQGFILPVEANICHLTTPFFARKWDAYVAADANRLRSLPVSR